MIKDFISIDLETTGLDPKTDKIIEIAAIRYRDGKETDSFDLNDSYTIKDCRFFKPSNTNPSVHPNTKLVINSGTISFNIPISNNIGSDLIPPDYPLSVTWPI